MNIRKVGEVLGITHDELVTLFSTALEGSYIFGANYPVAFYKKIPADKKIGDCFEDAMADVVLNGGEVEIIDRYADRTSYGGDRIRTTFNREGKCVYHIGLKDILAGLTRCMNGQCKECDIVKGCIQKHFEEFERESTSFDLISAESLLQGILFDEYVYG